MILVGEVESLWRYPVKSMGGESVRTLRVGPQGVEGDRLLAFASSGAPAGKPLLRGSERHAMLRYRARFRAQLRARFPAQLQARFGPEEARPAEPSSVEITTPGGRRFLPDDPALLALLQRETQDEPGDAPRHTMWLKRSDRPMTDCRPIALLSTATLAQLSSEMGLPIRADRFRANVLLTLHSQQGFEEDGFVGRQLLFGEHTRIAVRERDPRCRIVAVDPATGDAMPALMTMLGRRHEGKVGIYGTAVLPGPITVGDAVYVLP